MTFKQLHIETLAVHAGQRPDTDTLSRGLPLHRTAAFVFKDTQHAANLFGLSESGYIYGRLGGPTQTALEDRVNLLEGGAGALAQASGTAAIFNAIINLAGQGDEIVSFSNLYGGTYTMFDAILPQFGIKVHLVQPNDFTAVRAAINGNTRALYAETIGNPGLGVADIPSLAAIAQEYGLPLILDATFSTPYLQRPLELGADIVIHSLSKWMGGHGTAIGGIVVDSGKFDWKNPRFTLFNEPDQGYHGLRWAHDLGDLPPYITRMRTVPIRNLGACISPDNAWLFMQGLETLHLRMERHCSNALAVAKYLEGHQNVAWVSYPGLPSHPEHELAKTMFKKGFGGMIVFGIKGKKNNDAKNAGKRFIERLKIFSHLANVGDAKSLAIHPGSTTHSQLSEQQQKEAGLNPEMIRLSIGIEHLDDLIKDLDQALE